MALGRSFPREGARGKVLGGQSQNLVAYGLELREYFANLIANLAIWQTALWCLARRCIVAPRCVQCGATTCNAVQGVRAMRATCNDRLAYWRAGVATWHTRRLLVQMATQIVIVIIIKLGCIALRVLRPSPSGAASGSARRGPLGESYGPDTSSQTPSMSLPRESPAPGNGGDRFVGTGGARSGSSARR